ncbi:MAG: hypothetical protein Q7S79_04100 [bacterium]|nr:hypothetical protein [bacterium]
MGWKERLGSEAKRVVDRVKLHLDPPTYWDLRLAAEEARANVKPEMNWVQVPGGFSGHQTWRGEALPIPAWMHEIAKGQGVNPEDCKWYPAALIEDNGESGVRYLPALLSDPRMLTVKDEGGIDPGSGSLESAQAEAEAYVKKLSGTTSEEEYNNARWDALQALGLPKYQEWQIKEHEVLWANSER